MKAPRTAAQSQIKLSLFKLISKFTLGTGIVGATVISEAAFAQEHASPLNSRGNLKMASFGDSITRAFNANTIGDHPGNSWSTGHSTGGGIFNPGYVNSHAELLEEATGLKVEGINASKSGATSKDLNRQIESLGTTKLDYATILIGANDLCGHGTTFNVSDYVERVESGVQKLIATSPEIKILLVSIPDLIRLQQIGAGTSCQKRWSTLGICKPILKSDVTPGEIDDFRTVWRNANEELALISSKYSSNVLLNTAVSEFQFEREHLSDIDCFHPNINGQNVLSQQAWIGGWWSQDY